jgi:hypothetical protein
MRKRVLSRAVVAACAATLSLGLAVVEPASAAPLPITNWKADVKTHVGALVNTDVAIPSGTFTGAVETTNGALTGTLDVPAATFTYNALLFIPTTVTFHVDQVGTTPITGTVDLQTGAVTAQDVFDVRLSSVKLFGIEVLDPATTCKSTTTSTASLTGTLDLASNPATVELSGNYAISALDGCGFLGGFVSAFTAGPTNSLDVTITQV